MDKHFEKNSIALSVKDIEYDSVNLSINADLNGMSIRGSGFISKDEFIGSLSEYRSFPLDSEVSIFRGGIWSEDGRNLDVVHIKISIHPITLSGKLIMRVELFEADFYYSDLGYGCGGVFDYHIDYSGLKDFLDDMELLMSGRQHEFKFYKFGDW